MSIFYKNYQKICIFFFNKYKKNNKKFVNIFLNNLNKSSDSKFKKNNYKNWFVEICAAKYLINKNFNDIDYIIDDEGFIQRAFTFALQKKIHQNIDQYLQFVPRPDFVINIKSAKNKIKTRSKLRLNTNNFTYKNDKEINKFFLAETLISSKIIKKTQILPFINKKKNFKKLNSIYEKIKK